MDKKKEMERAMIMRNKGKNKDKKDDDLDEGTKSMMAGMGLVDESQVDRESLKKKKEVDPGLKSMMEGMGLVKDKGNSSENTSKQRPTASAVTETDFGRRIDSIFEMLESESSISEVVNMDKLAEMIKTLNREIFQEKKDQTRDIDEDEVASEILDKYSR